jgi:DNA-binding FrmR family transcriptional regulator
MSHLTKNNKKILARVRRLKGQISAIEQMLDEKKECYKILQNVAACRGALNSLTKELLNDHITHHIEMDETASESVKISAQEVKAIISSYLK